MSGITDIAEVIPTWAMSEENWLKLRELGLGGSDAGTICGLNKYSSRLKLWSEKLKLISRDPSNDAMEWGHLLEEPVAIKFARDYEQAVVNWPVALRSKVHTFLIANIDFWIVTPSEQFPAGQVTTWEEETPPEGITGILECKTTGIATPGTAHHWDDEAVPDTYAVQGIVYGVVSGVHAITFAALLAGKGLVVRKPQWDDEIADDLVAVMADFWELIETKTEPEPDGSDATEEALKARYPRHIPGKTYEGGAELEAAWAHHQEAKAGSAAAVARAKQARAELVALLGDSEEALLYGVPLCSFRTNKDSDVFDEKKFAAEHPAQYREYLFARPGARQVREIKN